MNTNSSEAVHMDSQLGNQSNSKKNIVWTEKMDICLTETLREQVHKGQKPDRSFSYHAYQATCAELYAKCGIKVEVDHIKNRLKTLKKDMSAFQDMQNSSSGFAFNRVTRMMDAEPKVWEDYIKDSCLIPESPFYLEGKGGLYEYVERRLKENGHMVIVVAEGAESTHDPQDASGNKLLLDVG